MTLLKELLSETTKSELTSGKWYVKIMPDDNTPISYSYRAHDDKDDAYEDMERRQNNAEYDDETQNYRYKVIQA